MLVLSRKPGERILIGESVVLTVTAMKGGRVRLGFEAPRDVAIVREELGGRPARGHACGRPEAEEAAPAGAQT